MEHSGIFDFKQFINDYYVHLWFKVIGLNKLTLLVAPKKKKKKESGIVLFENGLAAN